MERRSFLAGALPAALAGAPAQGTRPNVLLVMMDDFGVGQFAPLARRLGTKDLDPLFVDFVRRRGLAYSPEEAIEMAGRAMPCLSELARGGAVFSNAFSPSNLCSPARAGTLMGRMQIRDGLYQNTDVERTGVTRGRVLAARLQKAGYATGFIGKWHAGRRDESLRQRVMKKSGLTPQQREAEIRKTGYLGAVAPEHHPLNNGFDYYFGYNRWECPFYNSEHIWENWTYTGLQERYNTELFTAKALDFINGARKQGKPFFVELAFHAVHGPLKPQAPDPYFRKFPSKCYQLSNFYAHVNAVDEAVAAIRAALGAEWRNTLLLFCADNGAPSGGETPLPGNAPYAGHKGMFVQGGFRIPMLAHWPAGLPPGGEARKEIVSMLDLMPTALDAAGVPAPGDLDGRSLLPLLRGQAKSVHEHLLWAGIHARAWGFRGETVIGGDAPRRREESPGAWVATDGRYLLRFVTTTPAGLFQDQPGGAPPHYELFDVLEDPGERRDLYRQIPQVAKRLQEAYFSQAKEFPPPTAWRRDRWREMVPPDNIHLK
jgi:uncharacterized sulfatase